MKKIYLSKEEEEMYRTLQTPGEKMDGYYLKADGTVVYLPKKGKGYIKQ